MNEEKVKAAFDVYMRENHDDDYTRTYSAEAIDNMYCDFSNGFEAACKRSPWPEIKESVTAAAKEMCEAWGMEDSHGYSVKDTFQVGFVQGSNWRADQSPWISVEERLPEHDNGQSLCNVIIKFDDGSHYIVANTDVEDMAKAGGATHWMAIPE